MNGQDLLIDLVRYWGNAFAISMARPLGMTLTCAAMLFGVNTTVIRVAIAFALSLPVVAGAADFFRSAPALDSIDFIVLATKETFLGAGLGLALSVPLAAATAAGAMIDAYRLETPALQDPLGGQTSSNAMVLGVLAAWTFAAVGGFWLMAELLYASYRAWPLDQFVPFRRGAVVESIATIASQIMQQGLLLAAPLLLLMFMSDFAFILAARVMRRLEVYPLSIGIRNVVMLVGATLYIPVVSGITADKMNAMRMLEALMPKLTGGSP